MVSGRRIVVLAAGDGRVDARGHGLFAVCVGLLAEGQLGGRGGAGGFLRDENGHEEGHDHRARPDEERRPGDESSLQTEGRVREKDTARSRALSCCATSVGPCRGKGSTWKSPWMGSTASSSTLKRKKTKP